MASLISQMRNAIPQQQAQLPPPSLSESIERTRAIMQRMKFINNQEIIVNNLLQSNPQLQAITPLLRNGNNLEGIAKQMAQVKNIDINQLINQLSGGF